MELADVACIFRRHTHALLMVYQSAYNGEATEPFMMVTQSGFGNGHFGRLLNASVAGW